MVSEPWAGTRCHVSVAASNRNRTWLLSDINAPIFSGFSGGTGFVGIAVALLGAGQPWAVLPAALFMGTLREGGLAVNHLVPKEIVLVIQAVAVLAVLVASRRAATLRWKT